MKQRQSNFLKTNTHPLAERMRPCSLSEFVGQDQILNTNSVFRTMIENDDIANMIFWGPPGSGKTTLAHVIAHTTQRPFFKFHAVFNGVKDIKAIIEQARNTIENGGKSTILFVDEIHRFNKAQQDAFLDPVETGTIILIGATTENPSFEINSALLSRCSVYTLEALQDTHIATIIDTTLGNKEKGLGNLNAAITDDGKKLLVNYANGDARVALTVLDGAIKATPLIQNKRTITKEIITSFLKSRRIAYDKQGEEHYNLISALHKSLRGSEPQAALYWLARMIEGGADPLYIARRLVRFASEDVGLADPHALVQAIAVKDACHFLGFPECDTALAQLVVYLATAPKSNKLYVGMSAAKKAVHENRNEPVPLHIRNAPTKLMKNLGYGKGYQYDHNTDNACSGQSYLPESQEGSIFYEPTNYGFEKDIKKRMEYWNTIRAGKK